MRPEVQVLPGPLPPLMPSDNDGAEVKMMKKILLLIVGATGGFVVYRRFRAAQAEEDLWIEATATEPAPAV